MKQNKTKKKQPAKVDFQIFFFLNCDMSWRAKLSRSVQELRFIFCGTSPQSSGVRNLFQNQYQDLKYLNPKLPFLWRPGNGASPTVTARYDLGREETVDVTNWSEKELEELLKEFTKNAKYYEKTDESVPDDFDVIQTYSDDPNVYERRYAQPFSRLKE